VKLIAALSQEGGLGLGDQLLFHIPEDLHRFQALTTGGTLVMGRKTMDTMPGGNPLPHRTTLVLTRNAHYHREGVLVAHSVSELLAMLPTLPQPVFVAGGGEIYALLLPHCSEAYLTLVDASPAADVFFPPLTGWQLVEESEPHTWENFSYRFCKFQKL
jgi:dihydrofolate reductase